MTHSFQSWFAPPVFDGDALKTRQAAFVNAILLGVAAYLCLLIAGVLLGRNAPVHIVLIDVLMLMALVLLRRSLHAGKVEWATVGLAIVGFMGITAVNVSLGTIRTPTSAIYLFYVLMVGALFQLRGLLLATAACSLAVLGMVWAENARLLPPADFSVGVTQWVTYTGLFGMTAGVSYRMNRVAQKALALAQEEIRQRKLSEETLHISEVRHRLVAENARDVIWTMAPDGRITYVSPSVEAVRGFTPEQAMRQSLEEIQTPASQAITLDYFSRLHADLAAGRPPENFKGEMEYLCKDGSTFWSQVMAKPILGDDGTLLEIVGVTRDIAEHKRLVTELQLAKEAAETANLNLQRVNAELARMATTDTLTGVANRRHFEEIAQAACVQARRYGPPLSLLMFDLDHFKHINDRHGHLTGDQVLVELTGLVANALRKADVLARWGGEEFVIITPHCGATEALCLAQKLRTLVMEHNFPGVGTVTISLGVAEFRAEESQHCWFRRVDEALYAAKAAGRNAVRLAA